MKSRFLLPHRWRMAGYVLLFVGIASYIITQSTGAEIFVWHNLRPSQAGTITGPAVNEVFDDEIQMLLILVGLLIAAFTKEKLEDEYIAQQRLESLQWAMYINYAIFIICILTVYGIGFFSITIYNVITPLIIFIIRFRWMMYRASKLSLQAA